MYIVQEFLSGGCLLDYLRDETIDLTIDDLHMMCIHTAMGMAYLESKQYIHRDLVSKVKGCWGCSNVAVCLLVEVLPRRRMDVLRKKKET